MACLSLLGLSSFGIWDPWEVEVADPARRLAEGQSVAVPHVGVWLVAQSFRLLGVHEWSARLPIALGGLATLALGYALVSRFAGPRSALYTLLIAGTSPLYLFNARTMLGEAPAFALQTAIAASAAFALFGRGSVPIRGAWLAASVAFAWLGLYARGALLCSLPPLAAVSIAAILDGRLRAGSNSTFDRASSALLALVTLSFAVAIARAAAIDDPTLNHWLGGAAEGGQPPSFDAGIERAFHAFAPWSGLLPLGLARLALVPNADSEAERDDERRLRAILGVWIGFSYGALMLYVSRYGHKVGLFPVVAFAAAVALFLRDLERSRAAHWPAAIAGALLTLLLLRDYALYPSSPVHGMPIEDFKTPEVFNPSRAWAAVLLLFVLATIGSLGAYRPAPQPLSLTAPYRFLGAQWRRGRGYALWLVGFSLVLIGLELFGVACFIPPVAKHVTTLVAKVGKGLMLVPPGLALLVAATQLGVHLCAKLGELRSLPVLVSGLCVGGYAAFGFMPALSAHFSPREIYETYNTLAKPGEPLVEYKVGARAAAYYAKGEAAEVDNTSALMAKLAIPGRAWAVFPNDELPAIDKLFRVRTQRHLFIADARNARALLATNLPVANRKDESFLSQSVKSEVPPIQHPVTIRFEDKIELLGYDLKLPHADHVGPGERFTLVWYFRVTRPPGDYRIFLHIDADAERIHGDHDPVDGKYPVRLWEKGDVIIDAQELQVPSNYAAGSYTMFIGFYSGETRLVVKEGANDGANRAIAGVLRIR